MNLINGLFTEKKKGSDESDRVRVWAYTNSIGAKWPITINYWNILPRNTVWEKYSNIPLFVVLEFGELEYPIFLFQRGTWHGIWNLKSLTSHSHLPEHSLSLTLTYT